MAPDASVFRFLPLPSPADLALASLGQSAADWFRHKFGSPTPAQCFAWPALADGDNLLLCAPTGTGKTLAAFLPILSRLLDEPTQGIACLYITPLKALGRDIGKNLRRYLVEMTTHGSGDKIPLQRRPRVGLRTGDTAQRVRQRQLARPPQLLLTTPESLAVLLTNSLASALFRRLRWVIVDEIHALVGTKRGADLALSLERLEWLRRENQEGPPREPLQRIGLSATCSPVQASAGFLVGVDRPCSIAQVADQAAMDLRIEPLPPAKPGQGFLAGLVDRLVGEFDANRTTLIFANSRALAERLAWALKRRYPVKRRAIGVHHSSLAAGRRRLVERHLKHGMLEIVVTSTSLELGIDIGNVDGVVFVHPPGGVARLLQRLGRSGHTPGRPRRGLLFTANSAELLEATVTVAAGRVGQLESLTPCVQPLDVLCQHLAGMAMTRWWFADEAWRLVPQAFPFRDLKREDFDQCLAYLSGQHPDGRAWLPPRLRWQGNRFAIINQRTLKLLRRNLGTILTEEGPAIRLLLPTMPKLDWRAARRKPAVESTVDNTAALRRAARPSVKEKPPSLAIGSVDDAFADRLRPGDRLLLEGRCFEFRRRERNVLLVDEVSTRPVVPVWHGSGVPLAPQLAERLYLFRRQAADGMREGAESLRHWLAQEYGLGRTACDELARLMLLQDTVSEIPETGTLLVEQVNEGPGAGYYFHTPLNRAGNDALARVVSWRLFRDHGLDMHTMAADLGFAAHLPQTVTFDAETWRTVLDVHRFEEDLATVLRDCASLRERFAQVATTGLMVLRHPLGGKSKVGGHDWAQRRLFDQVRETAPGFLLLRQAEKEILAEVCDVVIARQYLSELPWRQLRIRRLSRISPFAAAWTQSVDIKDDVFQDPVEILANLRDELMTPATVS